MSKRLLVSPGTCMFVGALLVAPSFAGQSPGDAEAELAIDDLAELSLEELLNVECSVASRSDEPLLDVYAAVYVIDGDELRRSGASNLQDALRMVPGFHVAQWKTSSWDVTARGFTGSLSEINESFANQLLLLVDGVSFYSPVMAGIWWPLVDVPFEDIERIEILRGPGGTLWGANAMNGVVHVITKHARDTQGGAAWLSGSQRELSTDVRQGFRLGERAWLRTWASYTDYEALPTASGDTLPEDWWITSVGARADWELEDGSELRVVGSGYTSQFGEQPVDALILGLEPFDDTPKNGGQLVASWRREDELGGWQRLQAWYRMDHQKQLNFEHDLQMADLEYTRLHVLGERTSLTWGAGYQLTQTDLASPNGFVDFEPEFRRLHAARVFALHELELPALDSKLASGIQLEESSLGDFQVQPTLRWLWRIDSSTSAWAAVSRAVRTPSLEEVDIVQYDDPLGEPFFVGNEDFESESVLAHEIGLRARVGEHVFLDGTVFYNDFHELQSLELDDDSPALSFGNRASAVATGFELAADWQVRDDWRLRSGYTYFDMDFEADAESFESSFIDDKDLLIPQHHVNLRSYWDIAPNWELDGALYWADELEYFGQGDYWRADLRLGWQASEHVELSLGGQNLTEDTHSEAGEDIESFGAEIERLVYLRLRLTY